MKKLNNKKQIAEKPNFDNDIKNFVEKLTFVKSKKEMTAILHTLFKTIESFDVDMWGLKSHLKQNMKDVYVEGLSTLEINNAAGLFHTFDNVIQIQDKKIDRVDIERNIAHELSHCMSSMREKYYSKTNGPKAMEYRAKTGFNSNGIEIYYDSDMMMSYDYCSSTVFTEGITELLASTTIKRHFGGNPSNVYALEKKICNQIYAIFGNEFIQAYFDNNFKFLENAFLPNKNEKIAKYTKSELDDIPYYGYVGLVESIFGKGFFKKTDGRQDKDSFYQNIYDVNCFNLALFAKKLIADLYESRTKMLSGTEVKETILKAFDLYARNIYLACKGPNRMYYDFWNAFADTIQDVCVVAKKMFKKTRKMEVPNLYDNELLAHVDIAQRFCMSYYFDNLLLEKVDIDKALHTNLSAELDKAQGLYEKSRVHHQRTVKSIINSDLTEEFFDPSEFNE